MTRIMIFLMTVLLIPQTRAAAQELKRSDIAPRTFGRFELDSPDWRISSANRDGNMHSAFDYEYKNEQQFVIVAEWDESARAGQRQGLMNYTRITSHPSTLLSEDKRASVYYEIKNSTAAITASSIENLARAILNRIESRALPWPNYYLRAQLPLRIGSYGLIGWNYEEAGKKFSSDGQPYYHELDITYGISNNKYGWLKTIALRLRWKEAGDTLSQDVDRFIDFHNLDSDDPKIFVHPQQYLLVVLKPERVKVDGQSSEYIVREPSSAESEQFDRLCSDLLKRFAPLAISRQDNKDSSQTTGAPSRSSASSSSANRPPSATGRVRPAPALTPRQDTSPTGRDEVAVVTLLTTLILAGTAIALSLSQAIAAAVSAAVQAGIEVTQEQVTEAVLNASAEQEPPEKQAEEESEPQPQPTPLPPLNDAEGDELIQRGDRYVWGDRLVSRAEAERLIEQERIEREAENERRLDRHRRQAEADWKTTKARAQHERDVYQRQREQELREQQELQQRTQNALRAAGKWLHERVETDRGNPWFWEREDSIWDNPYEEGAHQVWGGGVDDGTHLAPRVPTQEERERYQQLLESYRRGEISDAQLTETQMFANELIRDGQQGSLIYSESEQERARQMERGATAAQLVAEAGKMAATTAGGGGRLVQFGADLVYTSIQNADQGAAGALQRGVLNAGINAGSNALGLDDIGSKLPTGRRVGVQAAVGGAQGMGEGVVNHVAETGSLEGYDSGNAALDFGMGAFGGGLGAAVPNRGDLDTDGISGGSGVSTRSGDIDRVSPTSPSTSRTRSPDVDAPSPPPGASGGSATAATPTNTKVDDDAITNSTSTSPTSPNPTSTMKPGDPPESSGRRQPTRSQAPEAELDPASRVRTSSQPPKQPSSTSPPDTVPPTSHPQSHRPPNDIPPAGATSKRPGGELDPAPTGRGRVDEPPVAELTRDELLNEPRKPKPSGDTTSTPHADGGSPKSDSAPGASPHSPTSENPDAAVKPDGKLQSQQVASPEELEPGRWHAEPGSSELSVINPQTGQVEVHHLGPGDVQRVPGTTQVMWHNPETGEIEVYRRNVPLGPWEEGLPRPEAKGPDAEIRNADPGTELDPSIRHQSGYTEPQIERINQILDRDENQAIMVARSTNMASREHIANGAAPKPEWIKSKTISELDRYLGRFSEKDVGLVGYFRPREPDYSIIPADLRQAVKDRYEFRLQEYKKLQEGYTALVTEGQMVMEHGKLHRIQADGSRTPFAGDIDPVMLLDKETRKPLSGAKYERIKRELMEDPELMKVGALQHGAEGNIVNDIMSKYPPNSTEYEEKLKSTLKLQSMLENNHIDHKEVTLEFDGKTLRRGPNLTHLPFEV